MTDTTPEPAGQTDAGAGSKKNPAELMLDTLAKHGLNASDYDLLSAFIDDPDKLDEMAGKLAARFQANAEANDPTAPRRPQPVDRRTASAGNMPKTLPGSDPLYDAIQAKLRNGLAA